VLSCQLVNPALNRLAKPEIVPMQCQDIFSFLDRLDNHVQKRNPQLAWAVCFLIHFQRGALNNPHPFIGSRAFKG